MGTNVAVGEVWDLIRPHTGQLLHSRPATGGHNASIACVVEGEAGRFFVKGVPNRPGGRRDSLAREHLVNHAVRSVAPRLLWHVEDEAWAVLGFEAVEGRRADFAPGSSDLPAIAANLDRIGTLPVPSVARAWTETRWDRFVDEGEQELFRGGALLHTDINPSNLMVGEGSVWAVDWAWPTLGAAFIDPALWVLQLISAGHTPPAAEAWAARCVAWERAEHTAVDAFARAALRMHREFTRRRPDETWLAAMADAAHGWAAHRGVTG